MFRLYEYEQLHFLLQLNEISTLALSMAYRLVAAHAKPSQLSQKGSLTLRSSSILGQSQCLCRCHRPRVFSSSARFHRQSNDYKESFGTRLRRALNDTKVTWYHIPVGLGIAFLGLAHLYRVNEREKARRREEEDDDGTVWSVGSGGNGSNEGYQDYPKKRERIRPSGPWCVFAPCLSSTSLMQLQAGSSNVHSSIEGYIENMGPI